jgi:hypothetical protein
MSHLAIPRGGKRMPLDDPLLEGLHSVLTPEQLKAQLGIHQQAIALLLEQRAAFGPLHVPTHLMHELRERHRDIVALKLLLQPQEPGMTEHGVTATDILLLRPWLLIISSAGIGALLAGTSAWNVMPTLPMSERVEQTLGTAIGALIVGACLGRGVIQAVEWTIFWKASSWRWRWLLLVGTLALTMLLNWGWTLITNWLW